MSTSNVHTSRITIRRASSAQADVAKAVAEVHEAVRQDDASLSILYASPEHDRPALGRAIRERFGNAPLVGCTTAGEISADGYVTGSLTGVSIRSPELCAEIESIPNLSDFQMSDADGIVGGVRERLVRRGLDVTPQNTFAFLLIDGLACQEEALVSGLHRSLSGIQLFGGSAADGVRFQSTGVYDRGSFRSNCAVLTLITTSLPFHIFKTQHFVASDTKMVVTGADPATRTVHEINGAPAAEEYARMVGIEAKELTETIFAAHPVVVQIGGVEYVRSIMKLNEDGSLSFACAIDEGIVLTVARGVDMIDNLKSAFAEVNARVGKPELVLGCDCLFRFLEMEQTGITRGIGEVLRDNNVIGFATYGEQYNAMHVNQTFTGVAIGSGA